MLLRRECEFYLLKYVPDPVRNEFVHVGVILREAGTGSGMDAATGASGRRVLRFTSDWRRVRCLDPEADTGMLEGLESELRRRFAEESDSGAGIGNGIGSGSESGPGRGLMHVLEDSFSNCVQVTRAKAYLAESLESGVEELMRMYVEPQKRERVSRLSGRASIQASMRAEFERAGVWDLLRKRIRAAEYTRAGDPMRIDVGYRNGVVRMFQAVSLDAGSAAGGVAGAVSGAGVEMAKVLAFSAAALRAGVERVEKVELELTAVVEPVRQRPEGQRSEIRGQGSEGQGLGTRDLGLADLGLTDEGLTNEGLAGRGLADGRGDGFDSERLEAYRFAVETMEEHRIRVVTTADLGRVAETARRELRV